MIDLSVRPRIYNVIAACLLIVSIGGHWALLQSVAWMGMLVSYSAEENFSAAIEKTFDGKHPCGLCKAVDHGKRSEEKKSFLKAEMKINWMLVEESPLVWSPSWMNEALPPDDPSLLVFASPPIPPPRSV